MLAKLNKLKNWQVAIIIAIVGLTVFWTGLTGAFQADDLTQIVNSTPVHSISNIKTFFEGGTFFNGPGQKLAGAYYRPLMTTSFSLIYTLFGPKPIYFHLLQLMFCLGNAFLLYLVFRYSFKPVLSLCLSLIFLLLPLNSEVVFAIPYLQDALFFFFGILGFWLLLRFSSFKSLIPVAICLFIALLAKETAILFVIMALIYLFVWADRKQFATFSAIIVVPIALWLTLKINAVGLNASPHNAPIDNLSLANRILTMPSEVLFYFTKLIYPIKLATAWDWTYTSFSLRHVLLPLIIDLAILIAFIYVGLILKHKSSKQMFRTYLFFAVWTALGFLVCLQLIPLDMTVSETWFYFISAGLLGMIGVVITVLGRSVRINRNLAIILVGILILLLGFRTAIRGLDYKSLYSLSSKNVIASKEDFSSLTSLAGIDLEQDKYAQAQAYAQKATNIFPRPSSYSDLGLVLARQGNYVGALNDYQNGFNYGQYVYLYEDIAELTLVIGNPNLDKAFLMQALEKFPEDSKIWGDLAIFEQSQGDNTDARNAIINAAKYGSVSQNVYDGIMQNQPFDLDIPNLPKTIIIK